MTSSENNLRDPSGFPDKKTYSKPQLQIYGDLKAITQSMDTGHNTNFDGSPGTPNGMSRTS